MKRTKAPPGYNPLADLRYLASMGMENINRFDQELLARLETDARMPRVWETLSRHAHELSHPMDEPARRQLLIGLLRRILGIKPVAENIRVVRDEIKQEAIDLRRLAENARELADFFPQRRPDRYRRMRWRMMSRIQQKNYQKTCIV